jgi:hypothetical protein
MPAPINRIAQHLRKTNRMAPLEEAVESVLRKNHAHNPMDFGGISPKHPGAKPMFGGSKKSTAAIVEEAEKSINNISADTLSEALMPGSTSRSVPEKQVAAKKGAGMDPALLVGGVAAAGLGAAALSAQAKKKSLLETVEDTTAAVSDQAVNIVETGTGYVNMALMPVMLGGIATGMIGAPLATAASWLGWNAPARGLAKVNGLLEKAQELTVAEAGQHLNTFVGHDVSSSIAKGAQKVADIAAPITHPISKIPGLPELSHSNIKALPKEIGSSSLMHNTFNGVMIAGSAASLYHVARDFSGQCDAGRQMIADRTGRKLEDVSMMEFLTSGNLSKSETNARNLLLSTAGIHALVETATLGMVVKTASMNKLPGMMGMMAWIVPDMIRQVSEGLLGNSILPIYKSMSDAQKAGQQIPAEAYAEFILAANEQLRNRGITGKRFAEELGKNYAENNAPMHTVLADIDSGKMLQDVNDIIARNKTEKNKDTPAEMSFEQRELQRRKSHPMPETMHSSDDSWKDKIQKQATLAAMTPASPSIN